MHYWRENGNQQEAAKSSPGSIQQDQSLWLEPLALVALVAGSMFVQVG